MDAAGNHDRRRTMERELTRHDMRNGVSIPSDWPLDELPICRNGGMVWIVLRDGVIPNKYWIFRIRRFSESEDPTSSPFKFLLSDDWRAFVVEKDLRVGDKIVITALTLFDLNSREMVDQFTRAYTITAQRKGGNGEWADIPPRPRRTTITKRWRSSDNR
ncbi:hypothetical protein TIFTF001_027983 [Ficus carica]|uniref:TF-B3 domain-containing protein n=1 Tax=Ficus carica TaxID=3494 RepID=A0AA88DP00_FICCA|nr:hypothetical protein TIFTF001_027983 [Ficus carica]